ncbi:nucleoside triphosphatase YtkD [Staphylococcus sp. SQ8-PEA]|uniref:Nucleoside triphosphatase YtkD n=1 Tax=Staphylococcus marylandisciuri TaxID=2981529 RepID=A0ABT2QS91_9STAP|nr:nucleoside triphosphatase YtkD [Staphylococcus marylandisciuri]
MRFIDGENDDVFLEYKNDDDPNGEHVLIIPEYQNQLLFTKHKIRGIEFPGGKKEQDESALKAMQRELYEETGAEVLEHHYIAQYFVKRKHGQSFSKDVFFVKVKSLKSRTDYYETAGPILFKEVSEISEGEKSYLLNDPAILHCLERVRKLGLY